MTSVASWGGATTAGNYTLTFSSVRLGNYVQSFQSRIERLTPVQRRHNFWSTTVLLDGKYPALTYQHELLLYTESGTLEGYIEDFYGLSDHMGDTAYALKIQDGDTATVVVSFGDCLCEFYEQHEPKDLLFYRAGMVKLSFVGNVKPSVI